MGGDSGAWVIDNASGKVCGHVLAYSSKTNVAYIAPMEVLLDDMSQKLGKRVTLPVSSRLAAPPIFQNSIRTLQTSCTNQSLSQSKKADFQVTPVPDHRPCVKNSVLPPITPSPSLFQELDQLRLSHRENDIIHSPPRQQALPSSGRVDRFKATRPGPAKDISAGGRGRGMTGCILTQGAEGVRAK